MRYFFVLFFLTFSLNASVDALFEEPSPQEQERSAYELRFQSIMGQLAQDHNYYFSQSKVSFRQNASGGHDYVYKAWLEPKLPSANNPVLLLIAPDGKTYLDYVEIIKSHLDGNNVLIMIDAPGRGASDILDTPMAEPESRAVQMKILTRHLQQYKLKTFRIVYLSAKVSS